MEHEVFLKKLIEADLNKKSFAVVTGLAYSTVANWSTTNNIPSWVSSWLENYIKAQSMDKVVEAVRPYVAQ